MRRASSRAQASGADLTTRLLEAGVVAVVLIAPLPFAAVTARGRLALELSAAVLLLIWLVRAARNTTALPGRWLSAGIFGLLALAAIQALPLGSSVVEWVSPGAVQVRTGSQPDDPTRAAEERLLGAAPEAFDHSTALSLDPPATASALRTGAALTALLLIASTVAAARGPRIICWGLLASAAFQGLYGLLVLVSGHPVIWNVTKKFYLDCATGTFVNRNHFAGFLAMSLPAGLALVLAGRARPEPVEGFRGRVIDLLGTEGSRRLLAGLLVAVGLAGLFLSYSRAGIGLGAAALFATALLARRRARQGIVVALLLMTIALVPLAQLGADRLAGRYARFSEDFSVAGGRLVVWKDTLRMVAAFPVAGVGFGSFAGAYPVFRSAGVRTRYDHAHNDLLQLTAEGGLLGLALFALAALPLGAALLRGFSGASGTLAVGLAAGLSAALLHALIDFNFHIPANAAVAAVVAGALLGTQWNRLDFESPK